jgi:hypothetical protein
MSDSLHLGLIVCHDHVPDWAYAAIERVRELDHVSIEVILRQTPGDKPFSGPGYALHQRYQAVENRYVRPAPDAMAPQPLAVLLPDVPIMDASVAHNIPVDVWVALNDGNRVPSVAARYGIWIFTHSGCQASRDAWDGLRELLTEQYVVESTLQVTGENAYNGLVLARTYSAIDRLPLNRSRNAYYWKSAALLARALQSLQIKGSEAFFADASASESVSSAAPLRNRDFIWNFVRYLVRTLPRYAYRALTFKQWLLLFTFSAPGIPESYKTFTPLMPPRDRLWADPQVVYHNGQYYIFVEEKLHAQPSGHLAVIVMDENGNHQEPAPILQKDYHLSYPHVFTWQGNWYMIPETSENRTIDAYRCTGFPDRWEYATTLMDNCTAYDTTLLYHAGKWWLFTCLQEMSGASSWGDELFLFYAENPLSQQWQPHPQNPIVSDIRSARPAGPLFYHDGQLYRPSQDSAQGYGHRLRFNRVLTLNETAYHEETVCALTPDHSLDGIHSFSRAQNLTMLDMRTRWFRWPRQLSRSS